MHIHAAHICAFRNIQETFWEHSGNIQGTFREHSGNIQGTFREHSENIQSTFSQHSVNNQTTFSQHSVNIQSTFSQHSADVHCPGCAAVCSSMPHTSVHSANIQGTFRAHSGHIQSTLRQHSVNIQSTFGQHSVNVQSSYIRRTGLPSWPRGQDHSSKDAHGLCPAKMSTVSIQPTFTARGAPQYAHPCRTHLCIQRTFREHSGHIQGAFSQH
jgi:hypothetical protein